MKRLLLAAVLVAAAGCGDDPEGQDAPQAVDRGRAVWVAQGCGTCHALERGGSRSGFGPDLDETLRGRPNEYVHESIVAPNAKIAAGFEAGTMPEDYAQRIQPDDLTALVEWLTSDR